MTLIPSLLYCNIHRNRFDLISGIESIVNLWLTKLTGLYVLTKIVSPFITIFFLTLASVLWEILIPSVKRECLKLIIIVIIAVRLLKYVFGLGQLCGDRSGCLSHSGVRKYHHGIKHHYNREQFAWNASEAIIIHSTLATSKWVDSASNELAQDRRHLSRATADKANHRPSSMNLC